jgi:PAS domain S-box-containing protein
MPDRRAEPDRPFPPAARPRRPGRSAAALARALAASETRLRALVVNAPDVIGRFGRDLRLRDANPAFEAALGRPPARLLGRTPAELGLGPEAAAWDGAILRAFRSGAPVAAELALDGPAGRREYEARLVPERRGGRVATVLAILRDVTEQAAAERARRERERRRAEFLAVLSHELRNPLAAVRNALWLLARTEPSGPREARAREILERQSAELARLVDDLVPLTPAGEPPRPGEAGPGLGLSLVRAAAQLHGGTVETRGEGPDGALEVLVRLPAQPPRPAPYGAIATSTGVGESTRTRSEGASPTRKPRDPPFT